MAPQGIDGREHQQAIADIKAFSRSETYMDGIGTNGWKLITDGMLFTGLGEYFSAMSIWTDSSVDTREREIITVLKEIVYQMPAQECFIECIYPDEVVVGEISKRLRERHTTRDDRDIHMILKELNRKIIMGDNNEPAQAIYRSESRKMVINNNLFSRIMLKDEKKAMAKLKADAAYENNGTRPGRYGAEGPTALFVNEGDESLWYRLHLNQCPAGDDYDVSFENIINTNPTCNVKSAERNFICFSKEFVDLNDGGCGSDSAHLGVGFGRVMRLMGVKCDATCISMEPRDKDTVEFDQYSVL